MFGISFEHILLVGVVLLIFGPKRLPELGNTLGKGIRNFKDAISGVEEAKFRHLEEEKSKEEKSKEAEKAKVKTAEADKTDPTNSA